LLYGVAVKPYGHSGADPGEGFEVSLVKGFAGGGPNEGLSVGVRSPSERTPAVRSVAMPQAAPQLTSNASQDASDAARDGSTPGTSSLQEGVHGTTARDDHGSAGAKATQGGDPASDAELIAQIARCLPLEERPHLRFSTLAISVSADGSLAAPPLVTSPFPRLSAEDRLVADHIVQAALQCGPYKSAGGQVITLPADFSSIQTGRLAAPVTRIANVAP